MRIKLNTLIATMMNKQEVVVISYNNGVTYASGNAKHISHVLERDEYLKDSEVHGVETINNSDTIYVQVLKV